MTVGKSVVIEYPSDVRQINISDPDVVDGSPVTTREILLNGKGVGNTTLIMWNRTGQRTFYNVNVEMNLEPLRRMLKESFPNETIDVHSSRDTVTLTGMVSNKDVAERATAMAAAQSKTVVNNLMLRDPGMEKQILLRVRFAELDREKEVQFGVNLLAAPGNNAIGAGTGSPSAYSLSGSLTVPPQSAGSSSTSSSSSATGAGAASTRWGFQQRHRECRDLHNFPGAEYFRAGSEVESGRVHQSFAERKHPADSGRAEPGDHQRQGSQLSGGRPVSGARRSGRRDGGRRHHAVQGIWHQAEVHAR